MRYERFKGELFENVRRYAKSDNTIKKGQHDKERLKEDD